MGYLLAPANFATATQLTDLAADSAGGNWTPHPDYIGTLRCLTATFSNAFSNPLDTDEALYVSSAPETSDFDAQFQIGKWGAGSADNFIGFCYRVQLGAKSFYRVRHDGTNWLLEKVIAGVPTTLGSVATPAVPASLGAPDVIDVHVQGNQHFVWITNATGSVSRTTIFAVDSSLASGRFGLWGSGAGAVTGTSPTHNPTNGQFLLYTAAGLLVGPNALTIPTPTLVFALTADVVFLSAPSSGGVVLGGAAPISDVFSPPADA